MNFVSSDILMICGGLNQNWEFINLNSKGISNKINEYNMKNGV